MLSCGSTEIDHVLFANAGESVFYHRIKVNETEFPLTFKLLHKFIHIYRQQFQL